MIVPNPVKSYNPVVHCIYAFIDSQNARKLRSKFGNNVLKRNSLRGPIFTRTHNFRGIIEIFSTLHARNQRGFVNPVGSTLLLNLPQLIIRALWWREEGRFVQIRVVQYIGRMCLSLPPPSCFRLSSLSLSLSFFAPSPATD